MPTKAATEGDSSGDATASAPPAKAPTTTGGTAAAAAGSFVNAAKNALTVNIYGNPLAEVRTAPLCGDLHEYCVGRAVRLYLRLQLWMSGLFVLMFLLSLLSVVDNSSRNHLRNDCRAALAREYDNVVHNASSSWHARCGYGGSGVRKDIAPIPEGLSTSLILYGPLTWALGACEEYTDETNWTQPVPTVVTSTEEVFVTIDASPICGGHSPRRHAAYWVSFLITLLILGGITLLRARARVLAMRDDRAVWSTADYSVLVRGLTDGLAATAATRGGGGDGDAAHEKGAAGADVAPRMEADALLAALMEDLAALGFGEEDVVQVEVGRRCRAEIRVLKKLEALNVQMHELAAKAAVRRGGGAAAADREGAGAGVDAGAGPKRDAGDVAQLFTKRELVRSRRLTNKMRSLLQRLEVLWEEPDYATGHAFIVFRHEATRNDFMKRMAPMAAPRPTLLRRFCSRASRVARLTAPPSSTSSTSAGGGTNLLPRSAAAKEAVQVMPAPEPSDVLWENLELTDAYEVRVLHRGAALIGCMQAVSLVTIIYVRNLKAQDEQGVFVSENEWSAQLLTLVLSALSSITTAGFNGLLKQVVLALTEVEGQDSHTELEASLFTKLSVAYTFNSAAIPILVGSIFSWFASGKTVDQSWYEAGGVCGQAWLLMVINSVAKDCMKVLRPIQRFRRRCTRAYSQARLNKLWRPPTFHIGDLYASTIKTTALGLAYGPIYPVMYLWTSVAYLFTYVCTRLSISHWYRRPPSVDESMVVSFCSGMTAILALNLLVQAFGCFAQGTSLVDGLPVYLLSPIVWLAYVLAPLERCFPVLRPYVDELEPDTDGIAYDDVPRIKKYEMEPYVCPKLTEDVVVAAGEALKDFQQMVGIPIDDASAQADAADAGQSCLERLTSSMDDLLANVLE